MGLSYNAAAALIVAAAIGSAHAVPPKKAAPRSSSKTATPAKKINPVSALLNAVTWNTVKPDANLAQACKAASFKSLAFGLKGAGIKAGTKTEFETQAQFEERTKALTDIINGHGDTILCQDLDDNEDVGFSYDAERQTFRVSFNPTLPVWRDVKQTGTYVSKTRMGIRATVHTSVDIEYIADMSSKLAKVRSSCIDSSYSNVGFTVSVPQKDASLLKLTGRLIILGEVIPPYYGEDDTSGSPTLDDPYDVYTRKMTVPFNPRRIAIIDLIGKEIWSCQI